MHDYDKSWQLVRRARSTHHCLPVSVGNEIVVNNAG